MASESSTRFSLLIRVKNPHDREAREILCELYEPLIRNYLRRLRPQEADLEDVTQDVLAKVLQQLPTFNYDPARSFRGWLRTLTYREFCLWWRTRARRGHDLTRGDDFADVPAAAEEWWEKEYDLQCLRWAVEKVRGEFDELTQNAFQLTYLEGMTLDEAAGALGVSIATVGRKRGRLFERVKSLLTQVIEG